MNTKAVSNRQEAKYFAALALAHLPTVHALFIRSVRALLRLRAAATGAAWERCPEWKMLPRLPQDRS